MTYCIADEVFRRLQSPAEPTSFRRWRASVLDSDEHKASRKIWKLLRANPNSIDDYGNRILFTLPRSPMTAHAWALAGSPASFEELKAVLLGDNGAAESALNFLFDYLAYYRKTTSILFHEANDEQHLIDLTNLLLECAEGADNKIRKRYERIFLELTKNITDGAHFVGLLEYFCSATQSSDETYDKYLSEFNNCPQKTLRLIFLLRDEIDDL